MQLLGSVPFVQPLAACVRPQRMSTMAPIVDDSFARMALQADADVTVLLEHPALAAMLRHARLSGRSHITASELLAEILASVLLDGSSERVLDIWSGHHDRLRGHIEDAEHLLPQSQRFSGVAYLVVGYDIGVAAPPDIILNVGHERFRTAPSELGFYATHEAHHAGFMSLRAMPAMSDLNDACTLREVIAYMTQLEGLGVHAAYEPRCAARALDADPDYLIYRDDDESDRVISRYAEIVAGVSGNGRLVDDEVGAVLSALSAGERLWYRFGALVAWTLERERGRAALVDSIVDPHAFGRVAERLLAR